MPTRCFFLLQFVGLLGLTSVETLKARQQNFKPKGFKISVESRFHGVRNLSVSQDHRRLTSSSSCFRVQLWRATVMAAPGAEQAVGRWNTR